MEYKKHIVRVLKNLEKDITAYEIPFGFGSASGSIMKSAILKHIQKTRSTYEKQTK